MRSSSLDSHIVLASSAPSEPWEQVSVHSRQKYTGRKEISRHKSSLFNAVKLHWFFPPVYLTDNIKSLLRVMSSWASEIASVLPISFSSLVEMFLAQEVVRRCWLWVIHLCKVWTCLLPLHCDTHKNCSTESQPQICFATKVCALGHRQCVVQYPRVGCVLLVGQWMDGFKGLSRTGLLVCLSVFEAEDQQLCNQTWLWPYLSGRSSTPSIMFMCHADWWTAGRVQPLSWSDLQSDLVRIFNNCLHCRN